MCEGIHKHTRVERLIKCPTGLDTLEYLCPICGRSHKLFLTNVDSLLSLRVNNFVSVSISAACCNTTTNHIICKASILVQ